MSVDLGSPGGVPALLHTDGIIFLNSSVPMIPGGVPAQNLLVLCAVSTLQ